MDPSVIKVDSNIVYKSKIANVPTPGYSGHTSIFIKPVAYINKDKQLKEEEKLGPPYEENQFEHVLNSNQTNNEVISR